MPVPAAVDTLYRTIFSSFFLNDKYRGLFGGPTEFPLYIGQSDNYIFENHTISMQIPIQ